MAFLTAEREGQERRHVVLHSLGLVAFFTISRIPEPLASFMYLSVVSRGCLLKCIEILSGREITVGKKRVDEATPPRLPSVAFFASTTHCSDLLGVRLYPLIRLTCQPESTVQGTGPGFQRCLAWVCHQILSTSPEAPELWIPDPVMNLIFFCDQMRHVMK